MLNAQRRIKAPTALGQSVARDRLRGQVAVGERCLEFLRFRGARLVGQRDLYPFAVLSRELYMD